MSREAVDTLVQRWTDDPEFRASLRQDPEGTVRQSGAELDADEWEALRAVDWSRSDDELLTGRESKGGG